MTNGENSAVTPGRACDGCTLCCKVLGVVELKKPQGVWCEQCETGVGCRIYDRRPHECRDFNCGFLTLDYLTEEWRPSRSKIVLAAELGGSRMAAHIDPDRPDCWRREPYYSQLKKWARKSAEKRLQVVVYIRNRAIVILPDKDVDLGRVENDELIITQPYRNRRGRIVLNAEKIKKDDPRAAKLKP